jgi:tRNA(Ile)-lysidine synthase
VPGQGFAADFGLRVKIDLTAAQGGPAIQSATLRTWRAGDRVRLRHSSASRKVKEVLEKMKVSGAERALWPVLEWEGRIVWMQGVVLEPEPRIEVTVSESPAEPAPAG